MNILSSRSRCWQIFFLIDLLCAWNEIRLVFIESRINGNVIFSWRWMVASVSFLGLRVPNEYTFLSYRIQFIFILVMHINKCYIIKKIRIKFFLSYTLGANDDNMSIGLLRPKFLDGKRFIKWVTIRIASSQKCLGTWC